MKKQILVVDDVYTMRQTFKLLLEDSYHVFEAATEEEALRLMEEVRIDIVLLDIQLEHSSGLDMLPKIKAMEPDTVVIMVTVMQDVAKVVEAMNKGASDYITKPFDEKQLIVSIHRAETEMEFRTVHKYVSFENEERAKRHNLIGQSDVMRALYYKMEQIARVDTSVLILGETGVGKEVVARALHNMGVRAAKPFIAVNCGAIPVNLLESELFGYEPGAFTGARGRKAGYFEWAHSGTMFLDEISELPLESQVKLLRVIQEGEYTRLGGAKTLFTDVVVYATSNRDLENMIAAGTFRSDLFYRLNVVQLHVPPLRERKSDIPLLVQYFIEKHCADMKIPIKSITPQAVEHLQNRIAWSGNIRELENTVLRAIVFTPDETITIESFKEMRPEKPGVFGLKPFIMQQIGSIELNKNSLDLLRKELQKEVSRMLDIEFLERSSKLFNGNISRIAENTGIYRTHLYKMMQRVGFDVEKLKE